MKNENALHYKNCTSQMQFYFYFDGTVKVFKMYVRNRQKQNELEISILEITTHYDFVFTLKNKLEHSHGFSNRC